MALSAPDIERLVAAHLETTRGHRPTPSTGVYPVCVECCHGWESGPFSGCDDYVRTAEAFGLRTTEEARQVAQQ